MKRELCTELLALIADGLMVASAMLCWRCASRYSVTVEEYKREMLSVESKQDAFEHRIVNMPAFLMSPYAQMKGRHFEKVSTIPTEIGGEVE